MAPTGTSKVSPSRTGTAVSPYRFNVAITRARQKLVVVGSRAFFTQVPSGEPGLRAHHCFNVYYHHCHEHGALFFWDVAVR